MDKYVALLRGINVGGHKKVPMKELKKTFERMGAKKVQTLLASGNVVYEGVDLTQKEVSTFLEKAFGFSINTLIFSHDEISKWTNSGIFNSIKVTNNIRLYITFLPQKISPELSLPYVSEDNSFSIIKQDGRAVFSWLDLDKIGTIDAMKIIEKSYGKDITTRNFNTVEKISAI